MIGDIIIVTLPSNCVLPGQIITGTFKLYHFSYIATLASFSLFIISFLYCSLYARMIKKEAKGKINAFGTNINTKMNNKYGGGNALNFKLSIIISLTAGICVCR